MVRIAIYPWEKWFSKNTFTVKRGLHYNCLPSSMNVQIRQNALDRGTKISIQTLEDGSTFKIRVLERILIGGE